MEGEHNWKRLWKISNKYVEYVFFNKILSVTADLEDGQKVRKRNKIMAPWKVTT